MNRLISALLLALLVLLIATAALRLVREFHERPVQVFFCDRSPSSCEEQVR